MPVWTRHPQVTPQMLLLQKGHRDPQPGHILLLSVQHPHSLSIYHRCSSIPRVLPLPLETLSPQGGHVSVGSPFRGGPTMPCACGKWGWKACSLSCLGCGPAQWWWGTQRLGAQTAPRHLGELGERADTVWPFREQNPGSFPGTKPVNPEDARQPCGQAGSRQ